MITVELSVALISSCLPSIFNLVKHGIRNYLPNWIATLRHSDPLQGPGGSHIGPLGNPIEENKHKGFVQLQSGRSDAESSNERLFDGGNRATHYTTAYPGHHDRDLKAEDPERGIPLDQIHVRDDIHVND